MPQLVLMVLLKSLQELPDSAIQVLAIIYNLSPRCTEVYPSQKKDMCVITDEESFAVPKILN